MTASTAYQFPAVFRYQASRSTAGYASTVKGKEEAVRLLLRLGRLLVQRCTVEMGGVSSLKWIQKQQDETPKTAL